MAAQCRLPGHDDGVFEEPPSPRIVGAAPARRNRSQPARGLRDIPAATERAGQPNAG